MLTVGIDYCADQELFIINRSSQLPGGRNANVAGIESLRPPVWFLALCTASAVMGLTILTPILPLITHDLAVPASSVQQLLTIYLIAISLGQLVSGPVSDRFGRRPVMLCGAVLYFLGGLATAIADSIEMLIMWRMLQGFGAAACMAMGRAIINDVFDRNEAARQMSMISMVLAIAPALSLAFGGILAEYAGWQSTMALLSFIGIVMFVSAFYLAAETNLHRLQTLDVSLIISIYRAVLGNRLFLCWAVTSAMQVGIFFVLNGVLAYQYQRLGYSLAEFGLWFALTPLFYVVGNTLNRSWFVARGIERAALLGCSLSVVAMLALAVTQSLGFTHALSLALPCCLFGFSNGIVVANATIGAVSAAS
ncbi:MAG: MFS transporter, partial [Granulosicoccus sp.]